jgi:hypothetical protein
MKQRMTIFNEYRVSDILNKDGTVNYYGKILSSEEANSLINITTIITTNFYMKPCDRILNSV